MRGFVVDDMGVIVVVLRIEIGVSELLQMSDGLPGGDCEFEVRLARDVAHEQHPSALGFGNQRRILRFGDLVVDFHAVITQSGLFVDHADRFLRRVRARKDRAGSEDGWSEHLAGGDLFPPQQVRRTAVEVENRGYPIGEEERQFGGRLQVNVSIGEPRDQVFTLGVDDAGAARDANRC